MWPFSLLFSDDTDESPSALVKTAGLVIFAPKVGVDKKKMLKQLQSLFGSDGKYVITKEQVANLCLPWYLIGEDEAKDVEVAFETYLTNRGRNSSIYTIISEKGMAQITKLCEEGEGEINGWKVYIIEEDLQPAVEMAAIHVAMNYVHKFFRAKPDVSNLYGLTPTCAVCEGSIRWSHVSNDREVICGNCGTGSIIITHEIALQVIQNIQEVEKEMGVRILPKELAA